MYSNLLIFRMKESHSYFHTKRGSGSLIKTRPIQIVRIILYYIKKQDVDVECLLCIIFVLHGNTKLDVVYSINKEFSKTFKLIF